MAGDGSGERRRTSWAWAGHLRLQIVLAALWAWLWYRVDPSLCWAGSGLTLFPVFRPDPLYLRGLLAEPGGPASYLAAWLAQWLALPGVGAGVLVGLAGALAAACDRLARLLAGRRLGGLRYAPVLIVAALDGHYYPLLECQLGWLAALLAADVWLRLPARRPGLSLAVMLLGLAGLYCLVGMGVLAAAPVLAVGAARRPEARPAAVAAVVWPAVLPWLSVGCGMDRALSDAYRALAPPELPNDALGVVPRMLALGVPAGALLLAALAVRAAAGDGKPRHPVTRLAWLGPAVAIVLLPWLGYDRLQHDRLVLAAAAGRDDWPGVVTAAKRLAPEEIPYLGSYAILLALAETGQMTETMFAYPVQPYSYLTALDPRLGQGDEVDVVRSEQGLQLCALELRLGFVNYAEHDLHETLETVGAHGRLLLPMARIQVLKGRPDAARVFLRLAAAQAGTRAEARALLGALDRDPTLAGDPVQAELGRHALRQDAYAEYSTTRRFELLSAEHPGYRLAAEYRLGWYLLSHQLDPLVAALPSLPGFGRDHLPRHLEEAVLCWEALHGQPAELGPWRVRTATRERFDAFVRALGCDRDELRIVLRTPGRPPVSALKLLGGPWSDTYYGYRLFGTSGGGR